MQSETIIPAPSKATPRAPRIAAALATVLALGLLALVIAHWGWQWFGPARVHLPPPTPADPAAALLASGLFAGGAPPAAGAAEPAPEVLGGDVRLLGVFAEARGRGYALFRMATGPKLVAAGKEIAPGAMLVAVRPDGIRVGEAGGERDILLRSAAPRAPAAATAGTATVGSAVVAANTGTAVATNAGAGGAAKAPTAARAACAPPPGFKGNIVALNAELMAGLIAHPESWQALVGPADGALVVRDESGFVAMLGLKQGDRLTQANGIALTAPDDIIGAVLRPLAAKQTVRLTGTRDGVTREVWLRNMTC